MYERRTIITLVFYTIQHDWDESMATHQVFSWLHFLRVAYRCGIIEMKSGYYMTYNSTANLIRSATEKENCPALILWEVPALAPRVMCERRGRSGNGSAMVCIYSDSLLSNI